MDEHFSDDDGGFVGHIGWVYRANLHRHTPLVVLRQHGQKVPVDGIRVEYGQNGHWYPIYPRVDYPGSRHGTLWSCGGQVPEDGGDVMRFLVAYREIIEDESRPVPDRVAAVEALLTEPDYARFVRALEQDMATSWVIDRLCKILNIGAPSAHSLVRHGHVDVPSIVALPDADLRAMPKVGPKTIAAIRLARARSV